MIILLIIVLTLCVNRRKFDFVEQCTDNEHMQIWLNSAQFTVYDIDTMDNMDIIVCELVF